ncbi:MAG TPA: hypothetical protein ENN99_01920 [Chloroflexi bacterium]|nr:hypothetical protein [Chloroflexota bacterium]
MPNSAQTPPSDIQRRLRELGVVKGTRQLAARPPRPRLAIEDLVPGQFRTTSHGRCFVCEERYGPDHLHGDLPLSAFLDLPWEIAVHIGQDRALASADRRRICFLDTETTGLSGGSGTMAFLVGLGFWDGDAFCLQQYFLRDPGDEPAMIETLVEQLAQFEGLVSFNGRAFDVPILENRFILARLPPPTTRLPHLDLLPPARRVWRYALPSCALGSLERAVLGVRREQADVPSGVIPWLYRDYLRTGDAREMKRVLYHNAVDILSLVTLTARLCAILDNPWSDRVSGAELYGLARWYAGDEQPAEAERAYRAALRTDLPTDLRLRTMSDLAQLLKRADRRDQAFAYWQQLALETTDDVTPHIELAKYLEWQRGNLLLAAAWTRSALALVEGWPRGLRRDDTRAELRHRLNRLERKLNPPPANRPT